MGKKPTSIKKTTVNKKNILEIILILKNLKIAEKIKKIIIKFSGLKKIHINFEIKYIFE